MENVPQWILDYLINNDFECPHCDAPFEQANIEAVSLRHAYSNKGKIVLHVEYLCNKCNKRTMLELVEISFEEMAANILNETENIIEFEATHREEIIEEKERTRKPTSKARKRKSKKRSKITSKETANAKSMLRQSESHAEWLKKIGAEDVFQEGKFRIIIPQVDRPYNDQDK